MSPADIAAIAALWTDREVMRYLGGPRPPDVARRSAETFLREGGEAITRDGELVGVRALRWTTDASPAAQRELELVLLLHHSAWGRGLATAAARELLATASGGVVGVTRSTNQRSQRLLERLGFRRDGTFERFCAVQVRYVLSPARR